MISPRRLLPVLAGLWIGCSDGDPMDPVDPVDDVGPKVGDVRVTMTTLGEDLDPDGYVLSVDGGAGQRVGVSEIVTLRALAAGTHQLELTDIADNCAVGAANPRSVTVTTGATATADFSVSCQPTTSAPDVPGQIAFSSDRTGNFEIHLLRAGVTTRLTNHRAWNGVPAISPDGTRILFESLRDGNEEIYVMNADGSEVTNLTRHAASDQRPSWSPDGSRILFVSDRTGDLDVFVMNADGSDPVNLTSHAALDRPAAWSPDGTKIAFSTNRTGDFEIFVMDVDGSSPVNITNAPDRVDFAPAWSPDGALIAYASRLGDEPNTDIRVMSADGSGQTNLTQTPDVDERGPSWSPDGMQIVFGLARSGTTQVYIMNRDGSDPRNLSRSPAANDVPGWPQAWRLVP